MKILFVYSDRTCSCTIKCCFELSEVLARYIPTHIVYYEDLNDEKVEAHDIIVFQRLGANGKIIQEDEKKYLLQIIERYKSTKKFVYLIDDLLLEDQEGFPKMLVEKCQAAIGTSEMMKQYLLKFNKKVYTFHTFIDTNALIQIKGSRYEKFTVVWASTGGLGIDIIEEIVRQKDKMEIDFEMIAIGGASKEFRGISWIRPYPIVPLEELISMIKGANILINPLTMGESTRVRIEKRSQAPIEDFLNCKAEIKYALAGITQTCLLTSSIDNYKKIIKQEENGMLVGNSAEEWIQAIKFIYCHPEKAKKMGENAYRHVLEEYDKESVVKSVIKIMEQIMG